jgi:hypothetical protein
MRDRHRLGSGVAIVKERALQTIAEFIGQERERMSRDLKAKLQKAAAGI